jgi:hypothetical protein
MKIREILLLVVIVCLGGLVHIVHTGKIAFFDGDLEWGGIGWGKSWSYEEAQTIEGPIPAQVEVINAHGAVDVRAGDQAAISLKLRKRIWRRTEKDALEISGRLKPVINRKGDRLVISTTRDEFKRRNFETTFILVVPKGTAVEIFNSYGTVTAVGLASGNIENRHGRVDAADIAGRLSVFTTYEDVDIARVGAECSITSRHADVRLRGAAGPVTVDHSYGKITAEDAAASADIVGSHSQVVCRRIKGPLTVRTSYEKVSLTDVGPATVVGHHAPVAAERVDGNLKVSTSYEDVRAEDVRGDFDVEGKSVGVTGRGIAAREIRVVTSYKGLDLGGFTGRAEISLSHGDAVLAPLRLEYPIEVKNVYSTIRFTWPDGDKGPFEARARGGEVKWGLAVPPSLNTTNGEAVVRAFEDRAGRPTVLILTTHGDIIVGDKASQQ